MNRLRRTGRPESMYPGGHYITLSAVAVLVLVTSVAFTSGMTANLVNLWIAYSIAALGFYWVFALAGRFAFAQTFMMALGGYTAAYLDNRGLDFFWCILGAIAVTCLAALLVGAMLWRTEHLYFALGTLAVTEIGIVVFGRTSEFTGVNGNVYNVNFPSILGYDLRTDGQVFWLLALVLMIVLLLSVWIRRSPVSRQLAAVRELPDVSRTLGVPADALRIKLFVAGSALGGLSGALITHWQGFIGVHSFGIDLAIGLFLIVILGGLASHWGVLIGAAFYVAMPELLSGFGQYMSILYGIILVVVILAAPGGLVGLSEKIWDRAWKPGRSVRAKEVSKS